VLGNYEIREELGRGAMGIVYHAFDSGLQREVAIKVLKARPDPRALGRFRHEGQAAARVQHPNVLTVHDLVIPERGSPYLVTDYAPGGSLRDKTLNLPPLSGPEIVAILDPLLAGVAALHSAGIVHRDLKPENVLFDENGSPLVADLGLARADDRETRYTQSGVLTGTPAYMAPEQLSGGSPTPATDVYALGVILYELLSGRLPFEAESLIEQIESLLRRTPPKPSSLHAPVDPSLEAICLRCLAKDPGQRPADAAALRREIQAWTPTSRSRSSPNLLLPLALVMSLVALGGSLYLVLAESPPATSSPSMTPSPALSATPQTVATPAGDPKVVLSADTLSALPGLEARRVWSLRQVEEGLRLRSFNGDGAQFTLPIRFREPGVRIRVHYQVRRLHPNTALRLAIVPDEPINPSGRPGGIGVFACSLVTEDPDERGLLGVRVSFRNTPRGRPLFEGVGIQPTLRSGPREVLLEIRILGEGTVVSAGGETKTFGTRIPPGEYRLELGPSPQGYLSDDPSRVEGYKTPARDLLERDFTLQGYDIVLGRLEIFEDSPKARVTPRVRNDGWARTGQATLAAWNGLGERKDFDSLSGEITNPHINDEAAFMGVLLTADVARPEGIKRLEALERLYQDSKGLNKQTWWFDDLGYGLEGERLRVWYEAGLRVNDLPRGRDQRVQLAHQLLGLSGQRLRSHHAAARALYCLLAAGIKTVHAPDLGVAWLYNGDLERARTHLEASARSGGAAPLFRYYAGLAAYWESDFVAAHELWSGLPEWFLSSDRERQRAERAARLANN
jgi:serine/threonine protein kinase